MPVLIVALGLTSCASKKKDKASEAHPVATETAKQATKGIFVRLDGKMIRSIAAGEVTERRGLADLLGVSGGSPGKWQVVHARAGAKDLTIVPSAYPTATLEVFPDRSGAAIGLFLPVPPSAKSHVRKALAEPHLSLAGIEFIDIQTSVPEPMVEAVPPLRLVRDGKTLIDLTSGDLASVPSAASFEDKRIAERLPRGQHHLLAIIESQMPSAGLESVTLHSAGASIDVPVKYLRSEAYRPLLKRNRQDQWVYRLYKQKSPGVQAELRGIERVETRFNNSP